MPRIELRCLLLAATLLMADVGIALCQQRDALSVLTAANRGNWYVRVRNSSSTMAEGRIRAVTNTTAFVGDKQIEIASVDEVQRRFNDNQGWKPGAIAGAVVVGSFGYLLSGFCEYECKEERIGGVVFGGLLGGIVGGTIGQMLSEPRYRWRTTWP